MAVTQLAVISDIHGNRWALEAVLQDVRRRGVEHMVNLGDSFYGPLDPAGTAELLLPLDLPTVRGNEDPHVRDKRALSELEKASRHMEQALQGKSHRQLQAGPSAWLENLPLSLIAHDEFFLCHGTPERNDEYLLHEVTHRGLRRRTGEAVATMLASVPQRVILCGHDHTPQHMQLPDGRLVVNPGSVGLQAYTDDQPYPHAMETGSPLARYSIVSRTQDDWHVEDVSVPYDCSAAARIAVINGRSDWAAWLRTGCSAGS